MQFLIEIFGHPLVDDLQYSIGKIMLTKDNKWFEQKRSSMMMGARKRKKVKKKIQRKRRRRTCGKIKSRKNIDGIITMKFLKCNLELL